jgi:uncharacterized repeat protein (TIGR01451 family)
MRSQYPSDNNQKISPNNNFGIVQYDLEITKLFVENRDAAGVAYPLMMSFSGVSYATIESGDTVIYKVIASNKGPAPAMNVKVRDYVPANMTITNVRVIAKPTRIATGDIALDRTTDPRVFVATTPVGNPAILFAGETVEFEITTKVTGLYGDLVKNKVSVYTPSATGDVIEKNYTPTGDLDGDGIDDDFKNNEDDVTIAIKSCKVDGYIYLDINNDNLYQTGIDLPMGDFPVTLQQNSKTYSLTTNGN